MKINEVTAPQINDKWFEQGSFKTFKKPAKERYEIAQEPGTIETLEGPVKYETGFYIMTGPKGEQYPITPKRFKELKDDLGNGVASPKKIVKLAKLADRDGSVPTSWGETMHYTAGNDYIVKHGTNDYGVVKKDIFAQTYDTTGIK